MSSASKIEWTDATWQPITGCTILSPGCTNCYAMKLAGGRLRNLKSRKGLTTASKSGPVWNGQVRFNEEWLTQPLTWRKPKMIFVCAHGDLFHESVPDEWIDKVFAVMALTPQHTYQVLTKRAERMRAYVTDRLQKGWPITDAIYDVTGIPRHRGWNPPEWASNCIQSSTPKPLPPLPNVWLGVSTERQKEADERIPHLLQTPAAVRFISAEPLLGPIDLRQYLDGHEDNGVDMSAPVGSRVGACIGYTPPLDWVICGGESGPGARPMHPQWARDLRDQCKAAGVPFFFKQWGAFKEGSDFQPGAIVVMNDGRTCEFGSAALVDMDREKPVPPTDPTLMRNVGKKAASRSLDNRTHDDMPGRV